MHARVRGNVVREEPTWDLDGDKLAGLSAVEHVVDENVKEELRVSRAGCRLWVELDREVGVGSRVDTLIRAVVGVDEQLLPARLE